CVLRRSGRQHARGVGRHRLLPLTRAASRSRCISVEAARDPEGCSPCLQRAAWARLVPMQPVEHTDTPDTIVGISFDDAFRSQEFLTASYRLASQGQMELRDAVLIAKDADGKTVVRET